MATKVISVLLASDTQPGTVPVVPAVGKWLTTVIDGEGVLRPFWDDPPEAELEIPGDAGALLYSAGLGALAAADGLIVVDSGNGLSATHFDGPGTVAPAGAFRAANNAGGYTARTTGADSVLVGGYIDASNNALYNRGTGGFVASGNTAWWNAQSGVYYWREYTSGNTDAGGEFDVMALSSAGLNLLNRLLIGVSSLRQDGTVSTAGFVNVVHGSAGGYGRNQANSQDVPLWRWGNFVNDVLYFGSSSSDAGKVAGMRWGIHTGGVFWWEVNGAGIVALDDAGFDMNGRSLTEVTAINGATVAAPTQGTAITTTATIDISAGSKYDVTAAGGAYAITLGTSGSPADGDMVTLRATNALANAVTITNGGTGGGNLGPGGVMTSGVKAEYYYYYDGTATAWKYGGRQRCQ